MKKVPLPEKELINHFSALPHESEVSLTDVLGEDSINPLYADLI